MIEKVDFEKLEVLGCGIVKIGNKDCAISTHKPNCDNIQYTIDNGFFKFALYTKNSLRMMDVFLKKRDDMDFSKINFDNLTNINYINGLKVISKNEVKYDGPWMAHIEKDLNAIVEYVDLLIAENKKKKEENEESYIKIFKDYYKDI